MTVPVMRSKRGTFVVDEDNLPDVEIEASVVLTRLKKILGLLDLIPPTEATEHGFRRVRHEVVEFSERIVLLQKYASEAGDSKGLPPPSGAKEVTKQATKDSGNCGKGGDSSRPFFT